MARKTDEELMDLPLKDLQKYATTNPAEGLRIAKVCGQTKKYAVNCYAEYQATRILDVLGMPQLNQCIQKTLV